MSGCGVAPSLDSPPEEIVSPTAPAPTATGERAGETQETETNQPRSDVETYVNEAYGFSFSYSPGWRLEEGSNYVNLSRGTVNLVVGYRHLTEEPNICCRDRLPEGELVDAGVVSCAGEEIDRQTLRCDGETKAVLYQGTEEIAVGELRFLFYLEDFNADYAAAGIPQDVQAEVDQIIGSLETFAADKDFATATPRPTRLPATPKPTTAATPEPTDEPMPTSSPALAEAQPDGANVRSGPGTNHGLAGFLDGGDAVEIIGRHADWWQVVYEGRPAWVFDGVVSVTGGGSVPRVDSPPTPVPPSPAFIPTAAPPSLIKERRWIDVDLSEQRLRAYEDGKVVQTTLVSTGLSRTPTVQGQFRIWIKLRHDDMEGEDYYLEDVPHVMYFYQGYGLHGAPWHNNFGHRMSHGCVNLPLDAAEALFAFADVGMLVNVRE
jgi:lipoprotein-anchoring transpeptidase ErfK/SrfK